MLGFKDLGLPASPERERWRAGVFNGIIVAYNYHMNFRMIHILFLALTLTFGICISSHAENIPSQHELDLLSLINVARENPLAMANSLGMDTDQILKDLPDLNDTLIKGLPPLTFNENLYAAASAHTRDMLDNSYYSHTSLDGRTYYDRIIQTGYIPVVAGESLGVLAFNNFIEPSQAVRALFENMFVDELDPSRTEKRNILDPELREAGLSVLPGTFNLDGSLWNVYLTTCDFGTYAIELALLEMINKARNDPYQALEMAGVDEASAREALGDYAWVLDQGLPPLAWNEQLHEAARGHSLDMIEHGYFSEISPEGEGPSERVAATGYEALYVGETLGALVSEHFVDPLKIACLIYENMVGAEFNPASTVQKNIFNPEVTEVGIGFERVAVNPEVVFDPEGDSLIAYVVVADFARPAEPRTFLVGNVYHDRDGDGSFDPLEGIAGLKISLKPLFGPGGSGTTIHSGPLGSYQLELHPFVFYELLIEGDDGNIIHTEFHGSQNRNELNNILIDDNPKGIEELRN